jgi:hypothetical protein
MQREQQRLALKVEFGLEGTRGDLQKFRATSFRTLGFIRKNPPNPSFRLSHLTHGPIWHDGASRHLQVPCSQYRTAILAQMHAWSLPQRRPIQKRGTRKAADLAAASGNL